MTAVASTRLAPRSCREVQARSSGRMHAVSGDRPDTTMRRHRPAASVAGRPGGAPLLQHSHPSHPGEATDAEPVHPVGRPQLEFSPRTCDIGRAVGAGSDGALVQIQKSSAHTRSDAFRPGRPSLAHWSTRCRRGRDLAPSAGARHGRSLRDLPATVSSRQAYVRRIPWRCHLGRPAGLRSRQLIRVNPIRTRPAAGSPVASSAWRPHHAPGSAGRSVLGRREMRTSLLASAIVTRAFDCQQTSLQLNRPDTAAAARLSIVQARPACCARQSE